LRRNNEKIFSLFKKKFVPFRLTPYNEIIRYDHLKQGCEMYRLKYVPGHHRADVTGLVAEHILVAEAALGRPLEKGELVHHTDFNKLNNEQTNLLFPISRPQHQKLPEYQARFIISMGLYKKFMDWWMQEQKNDEANSEVRELERRIVKEQNERERLQKYASS